MAVAMVARQGRDLQRYSASTGGRIVVGCVPYRVRGDGDGDGEVEVLVICSRKKGAGAGVMPPRHAAVPWAHRSSFPASIHPANRSPPKERGGKLESLMCGSR